ncbi:MAG: hypothetical protein RL437_459 [Actinomycetota bacterium]|jgi:hypothetical protein
MNLKSLIILSAISLGAFSSCTTMMFGTKYNYSYGLMGNDDILLDSNTVMHFEDSLVSMDFLIGQTSIRFTMQNKSGKTARIIWDETLFIKYGSPGRVMHSGVKYTERNNTQPASTVPANTKYEDVIIPSDNVYWRDGYYSSGYSRPGGWETRDLFPAYDMNKPEVKEAILNAKGVEFQVFMPIQFGEDKKEYTFRFKIRNVSPEVKPATTY